MSGSVVRPAPWALPPDGFHFEAVEDARWRVGTGQIFSCRQPKCENNAVATFMRVAHYKSGRRDVPYRYCADHMYGRWIEDGKVLNWRLVPDAD